MEAIKITENELLAALAVATSSGGPQGARTVRELVAELGLARTTVTSALRVLHDAGRLVVHQVKRQSFDGKNRPVSAYTIIPVKRGRT